MPAPKPSTVSSEMKNKVWNVSLKTFVLKGLLKKFKGRGWVLWCWWYGVVLVVSGTEDVPFQNCVRKRAGVYGG